MRASWRLPKQNVARRLVIAWGGDGTINEVASALVFGSTALGIVPSGSGNGLASELNVSRRPERGHRRGDYAQHHVSSTRANSADGCSSTSRDWVLMPTLPPASIAIKAAGVAFERTRG